MRHPWNIYRTRAARFAERWAGVRKEKSEKHTFYNEFFKVFDIDRRSVARFEEHVKRLDDTRGFIDLFWSGRLLVEHKSAGGNLEEARAQAMSYYDGLEVYEHPRYVLLCDFQNFALLDMDEGEEWSFTLSRLPENIKLFSFMLRGPRRKSRKDAEVDIKASELMGGVYDSLETSGYKGHELARFLVRLVFCFFADSTGIFRPHLFLNFLEERTAPDGSDLGGKLSELFQVLDTPQNKRFSGLDETLDAFPYVNGALFAERLKIPAMTGAIRHSIIEAGGFDWSKVSPAIFGALFQSVMDKKQRREQGAHYTAEDNILKIIYPLFMDDLRREFEQIKDRKDTGRRRALRQFHERLGALRFFDPACGCGNFLIVAYGELRRLEIEVLLEIHPGRQRVNISLLSRIDVNHFYGIELLEFPARIAETAMWMTDHIMNNSLSDAFNSSYARIPLKKSSRIEVADALEFDWAKLIPPEECDYVLGNPPFVGHQNRNKKQSAQMLRLADIAGGSGALDYVAAWYVRAAQYIQKGNGRIGFVATNSICQGEQVAWLWPPLLDRYGLEITFAHRTFEWSSEARGKAHVHVVLIGLARREDAPEHRRLFSYETYKSKEPTETPVGAITPYLTDGSELASPHIVVKTASKPINRLPALVKGSSPIDKGHYIFTDDERREFLKQEPGAEPFMRPYVGAREFLRGEIRFILYLREASPSALSGLPKVRERMAAVREFRQGSNRPQTLRIANAPAEYDLNVIPVKPFLAIPRVSSELREYMPIGWLEPPVIPSDALHVGIDASKSDFAVLTSAMHMAWLRHVGGRLKSDIRYSVELVYNTFPIPEVDERQILALEPLAQTILDERGRHADSTLAELYTPDLMPPALRSAHQRLDRAVDRLYRRKKFNSEDERVAFLLKLYENRVKTLNLTPDRPKPRRRRRTRT